MLVHGETETQKTAILDAVLSIAQEAGASASQVAIAWLRARHLRSATSIIPILGPRTPTQLADVLGALDPRF